MKSRLPAVLVMAALLLGLPQQVWAQSGPELSVQVLTVQIEFGNQITFQSRIQSSVPITQANIFIRDDYNNITRVQPVQVGADGLTTYRFENIQTALHPFSMLTFWYEASLQNGQSTKSKNFFVRYIDNRFPWQTASDEQVWVHWYEGDPSFGQALLDTANQSLTAIGEMVPLKLDTPVEIYVYASSADLQGALFLGGEPWVGGNANPKLGVALAAITPGPGQSIQMETLLPHELAHVMLYRQVGEGYSNLPVWLSEGIASQSELYPNPDYAVALEKASKDKALLPISDLCDSFPLDASRAYLAYAESASFVRYLRDTYGNQNLYSLTSAYADGLGCDQGAIRSMSASLDELDTRWRETVLGENPSGIFMRKMTPYLVVLGLFILLPFIGMLQRRLRYG